MTNLKVGDRVRMNPEYARSTASGSIIEVISDKKVEILWDCWKSAGWSGSIYIYPDQVELIDMTIDELERQLKDLKDQAVALENKIESAKNARKF